MWGRGRTEGARGGGWRVPRRLGADGQSQAAPVTLGIKGDKHYPCPWGLNTLTFVTRSDHAWLVAGARQMLAVLILIILTAGSAASDSARVLTDPPLLLPQFPTRPSLPQQPLCLGLKGPPPATPSLGYPVTYRTDPSALALGRALPPACWETEHCSLSASRSSSARPGGQSPRGLCEAPCSPVCPEACVWPGLSWSSRTLSSSGWGSLGADRRDESCPWSGACGGVGTWA